MYVGVYYVYYMQDSVQHSFSQTSTKKKKKCIVDVFLFFCFVICLMPHQRQSAQKSRWWNLKHWYICIIYTFLYVPIACVCINPSSRKRYEEEEEVKKKEEFLSGIFKHCVIGSCYLCLYTQPTIRIKWENH